MQTAHSTIIADRRRPPPCRWSRDKELVPVRQRLDRGGVTELVMASDVSARTTTTVISQVQQIPLNHTGLTSTPGEQSNGQ